jgi:integrase
LAYAAIQGWRSEEAANPAQWRGRLQLALPSPGRVRRVEHHAALPWKEMPAFYRELASREGMGAIALRFCILTACRSGEARGATWAEIDLASVLWTVPAARMKAGKAHRVPLSAAACALLAPLAEVFGTDRKALVFPGRDHAAPLSDMSLTAVLRRMGRADLTVHGFRSTFRDWAAETTDTPNHVVEQALAHAISSSVEAAYRRGDLFEKRRQVMTAWAEYCMSQGQTEQ